MHRFPSVIIASILVVVFFLLPSLVAGQSSNIPDLYIGSDDFVKIPLAKRNIDFPLPGLPDSLGGFLPELFTLKVKPVIPQVSHKIVPTLHFRYSSPANAFLSSVVYIPSNAVHRISLSGGYYQPESDFSMSQFKLSLLTHMFENLNMHHILVYLNTHTDKLETSSYSYSMMFDAQKLNIGEVHISNMESRLAFEKGERSPNGVSSFRKTGIAFENRHNLTVASSVLENQILGHSDYLGLQMMYAIPMAEYLLSKSRVGFVTDFTRILPAVEFSRRVVLGPDRYFDISNTVSIIGCSRTSLAEQYPWSAQPPSFKARLIPVNLHLGLYDTTAEAGKPNSFGIINNFSFSYNAPHIATNALLGTTSIEFANNIKNTTSIISRWDFPNASINQDVSLNFDYIHKKMWGRCSYSPLLSAETKMRYNIGEVEFELNLTQEYLSLDESGKDVPAVFDLGLQVKYPLTRTVLLTSWWKNLFNTPYHYQGDIPKSGRTVGLAFSYRPAM